MDFKELVHQAERNAKRQERKVHEAEREMKARQQQQMERLAYEKAREKLVLKRRAAATAQQQHLQQSQNMTLPPPSSPPHMRIGGGGTTKRKRSDTPLLTAADNGHRRGGGGGADTQQCYGNTQSKFVIPKKSGASTAVVGSTCPTTDNAAIKLSGAGQKRQQNAKQQFGQAPQTKRSVAASVSSPFCATEGKRPRISNPIGTAAAQPKHDPFKELMAQATQNDASAVERLIEQADEAAASANQSQRHRHKAATPVAARKATAPEAEVGVSAGRELTYAAAVRERLARQQQEAAMEKQKRLSATGYRILPSQGTDTPAAKPAQQKSKSSVNVGGGSIGTTGASKPAKITHHQPTQEQRQQQGMRTTQQQITSRHSNGALVSSSMVTIQQKQQQKMLTSNGNNNNNTTKMAARGDKNLNSSNNKMPTVAANAKKTSAVPKAQQQQSQLPPSPPAAQMQPQKRYLPGDIRYRANGTTTTITAPTNQVAGKKVPVNHQQTVVMDKRKALSTPTSGGCASAAASMTAKEAAAVGATPSKKLGMAHAKGGGGIVGKMATTTQQKMSAVNSELDRIRAREMELEAQLREEREKVARMVAMAKEAEQQEALSAAANRKRKLMMEQQQHQQQLQQRQAAMRNNNGTATSMASLARIKREAQLRRQMALAHHRDRPSSSRNKYANYSETDEDEEEDAGRYDEDDDEYDSDLADFIDDSMVDDLQREDFEETLKIINPRYNKEKWLARERMIDERRMDARFRDVEAEERHSSRLGLVEDLREAKRGSKALG